MRGRDDGGLDFTFGDVTDCPRGWRRRHTGTVTTIPATPLTGKLADSYYTSFTYDADGL